MMNSFQLWMKVRIAVVKTPGAAAHVWAGGF
ncbi:hypothetical protein ABH915_001190 [Arthrobacter sp. MW3 TE3886]